jgi:hypothetical protein
MQVMILYKNKIILTAMLVAAVLSYAVYFFGINISKVNAAPPQCFNFDGTTSAECQDIGVPLEDDKCYTETRSGPSASLTGYQETSCTDATDRDMDGTPGGARSTAITEPKFVKSDCSGDNISANAEDPDNQCGILDYLVLFINVLSALVGIVVVGSIIYGGIQYSTAGSDPQKVSAAKNRIRNAIIALIFFIFTYSFLNYLVPGGVL